MLVPQLVNKCSCSKLLCAWTVLKTAFFPLLLRALHSLSEVSKFLCASCLSKEIRRVLFLKVPEARKVLLLSEIDRVAQVGVSLSCFFSKYYDAFNFNWLVLLLLIDGVHETETFAIFKFDNACNLWWVQASWLSLGHGTYLWWKEHIASSWQWIHLLTYSISIPPPPPVHYIFFFFFLSQSYQVTSTAHSSSCSWRGAGDGGEDLMELLFQCLFFGGFL